MIPFLMILWVQMQREDSLLYPTEAYVNVEQRSDKPLSLVINKILKRTFDIVVSLLVIGFLFPIIFPVIIFTLFIGSRGPIFYFQNRSGINKSVFKIIKFRTLTVADTDKSFSQVSKNDIRITRFGKILRKHSIDELPQFFNVLNGEMSLVGPRPQPLQLDEDSAPHIPNYYERLQIKPGITGWAQVNGYRGATNTDKMRARVQHDLWYIENWSFLLDIRILIGTVFTTLFGEENAF